MNNLEKKVAIGWGFIVVSFLILTAAMIYQHK